jgi:hypothetical protein
MMGTADDSLAMFGLDAGAADAARAAVAVPGRPPPSARSPIFSGPPPLPAIQAAAKSNDTDDLPKLTDPLDHADEEESTRAVPRDELLRSQDAHVVVGDDAAGDDATLAVGPGENEASSKHRAALAQTITADSDMAFPPAPGMFGPPPNGPMGAPPGPPSPMGGMPLSHPQMPPSFQGWGPPPSAGTPGRPVESAAMPGMAAAHDRPTLNPHTPTSNPHMMAGMPQSGHVMTSSPMGGPMTMPMQPPMQLHGVPMGYPGQHGGPMMHAPQGWGPPAPNPSGGKRSKISGQIILLAVVGFICLAIFVTGIVLFATTKF